MQAEFQDKHAELLKEARAADRADRHAAELFSSMIKTEAWQLYLAMLNRRIEGQGALLTSPAGSIDGVLVGEYEKGTMRGLLIARDLPALTMKAAEQLSDPDTGDAT